MASFKTGNNAAVKLTSTTVVGMGNWKISGISVDLLETTAFGDTAKQYLTGLLDYGTITFAGLYDPTDSAGQAVVISACENNSKLPHLRLYVDNTSYWAASTGILAAAGCMVTSYSVGIDKSGLGTIEFTAKATGPWRLV